MAITNIITNIFVNGNQPSMLDGWATPAKALTLPESISALVKTSDDKMLAFWCITAHDLLRLINGKAVGGGSILFSHALNLKRKSEWAYLLIQGKLERDNGGATVKNGKPTKQSWASVQGALRRLQELGITYEQDTIDFAPWIERIGKSSRDDKKIMPVIDALFPDPGEAMLLCLPGMTERHLIEVYRAMATGNVAYNYARALAYLTHVPLFGEAFRLAIRNALDMEENELLRVFHLPNMDQVEFCADALHEVEKAAQEQELMEVHNGK